MLISSIILPLYIYPTSTDPLNGNWSPLFKAISANPLTKFTVIVNPASGPGPNPYPDSNWIANIAQLNNYASVTTLGYVHTTYGTRNITAAINDVNTYRKWSTYPAADIHVEGVFYDEAPSAATPNTLTYMQNLYMAARSAFPPGANTVMTNPGVQVDPRFFTSADYIVVFENAYSAYSPGAMALTPKGNRRQATGMVHSFNGTAADQQQIVTTFNQAGYGSLLVTTTNDYNVFSNMWESFCAAFMT